MAGLTAVYDRQLDGTPLRLAATGWTYANTFVLYDLDSGSLWYPLATAPGLTCVNGVHAGRRLPELPSQLTPWNTWRRQHPDSAILAAPAATRLAQDGSSRSAIRHPDVPRQLRRRQAVHRVTQLMPQAPVVRPVARRLPPAPPRDRSVGVTGPPSAMVATPGYGTHSLNRLARPVSARRPERGSHRRQERGR